MPCLSVPCDAMPRHPKVHAMLQAYLDMLRACHAQAMPMLCLAPSWPRIISRAAAHMAAHAMPHCISTYCAAPCYADCVMPHAGCKCACRRRGCCPHASPCHASPCHTMPCHVKSPCCMPNPPCRCACSRRGGCRRATLASTPLAWQPTAQSSPAVRRVPTDWLQQS